MKSTLQIIFDHEPRSNRGLKNCLVVVVAVVVGLVQVQWLLKYNSPIYENSWPIIFPRFGRGYVGMPVGGAEGGGGKGVLT